MIISILIIVPYLLIMGVKPSISDTYYYLPVKYRDYIFFSVLAGFSFPIAYTAPTTLMSFAVGFAWMTGIAGRFKDKEVKPYHYLTTGRG